ncbi:MAG: hypothetical protein KJ592_02145 [Nanoarchaeota archaeon]|nr:hypothetical protein [Nanoarchaeota archaeon]
MVASLSVINYFTPIFAFLLVFVVIYALLKSTKVLGGNEGIMLFISFILSSFFIVEASLVEFVRFSSAWMTVLIFCLFIFVLIMAFIPGVGAEGLGKFLGNKSWFAWVLLAIIIGGFIISSAYVFNWAVNWGMVYDWFYSDWFGMVLLLLIAGVVSWRITK